MNAYNYIVFCLTDKCNTVCKYCFKDSTPRKTQFIPFEVIKKCFEWCIARADDKLFVQFTGGEPSLHPNFWEIFQYARSKGYSVKFTTNGLTLTKFTDEQLGLLTQKGVAMKISLDGYDQTTHEFMRARGTFDRIMAGIEKLKPLRPRFAVKSVLSPAVAQEFRKMLDLSLAINAVGISYNFLRPEGRAVGMTNAIDEFAFSERAIKLFNQPKYKHLLNGTRILGIWMRPQIGWEERRFYVNYDGAVYPSQKANPAECIGNVHNGAECLNETKLVHQRWEVPLPLYQMVRERLQIQGVNN